MIKTSKLEAIITKHGIIKEFAPLNKSVSAHYRFDGERHFIIINESIQNNEKLYRSVLAEEISHFKTAAGAILSLSFLCIFLGVRQLVIAFCSTVRGWSFAPSRCVCLFHSSAELYSAAK